MLMMHGKSVLFLLTIAEIIAFVTENNRKQIKRALEVHSQK